MIVSDAASGATQRVSGPDDERIAPDFLGDSARFVGLMSRAADRHIQAYSEHQVLENLPILPALDRLGIGADHFDAEFFQRAATLEGHGGVEGGLAAEGRQKHQLVRGGRNGRLVHWHAEALQFLNLPNDNFFDAFRSDWLDISSIRELRVGHDRRRVGVNQNDTIALFLERLASLGAGVIELTSLANNDWPRSDDQDGMNVSALRHKSGGINCFWRALSWFYFGCSASLKG